MQDYVNWNSLWQSLTRMLQSLPQLDRQQWILVFCGALLIGIFCMRGFGSRKHY